MKRLLRFCLRALTTLALLAVTLALLFAWYVYTPAAPVPQLAGTLDRSSIDIGGVKRSYQTYLPPSLPKGAPLVMVMHGSGGSATQIRLETGYAFERLADQHAFALAFPNAIDGYWDACNIVGDVGANGFDDVKFLTTLVDKLVAETGVDANRVFAVGSSRGGSMALRLALEAPSRFRAVAAISSSVPTTDNSKCKRSAAGASSVLIMNGTDDPLVPFDGGQVSLFGLLYKNGAVRSSRESAQYFADLDHLASAPDVHETPLADGVRVERMLWHDGSAIEVELAAIHGAGHGLPQPYRRRPRLLGPSPSQPNGAELIWEFFARQR